MPGESNQTSEQAYLRCTRFSMTTRDAWDFFISVMSALQADPQQTGGLAKQWRGLQPHLCISHVIAFLIF